MSGKVREELVETSTPHGSYCGKDSIAKVKVTVLSLTAINLHASDFFSHYDCNNEPVVLQPDGNVFLPQINNTADCIHRLMTKFDQNPAALRIHYYSPQDYVVLSIPGISPVALTHC